MWESDRLLGAVGKSRKDGSRLWGEDVISLVLPAAVEQLHIVPSPTRIEKLVQTPSLKYGGSFASQGPNKISLAVRCPMTGTFTHPGTRVGDLEVCI